MRLHSMCSLGRRGRLLNVSARRDGDGPGPVPVAARDAGKDPPMPSTYPPLNPTAAARTGPAWGTAVIGTADPYAQQASVRAAGLAVGYAAAAALGLGLAVVPPFTASAVF